jgi:hypothetical protein
MPSEPCSGEILVGKGQGQLLPFGEGVFATSPYLHNGSVRTLTDLLTPPEQRPRQFRTGSNLYNPRQLGLEDAGPFVYDTSEPGKGAQGHDYGTDLPAGQKRALLEYLKSL